MELSPVMQRFVLHWGEMGTRWGVNRSVAQVHALLYLADRPLDAEEIAETLAIARSNVSNSLRELQAWELIRRSHAMGDRRDHFEAKSDTWEILTTIVEGRKRREIDPTIEVLRQCVADAEDDRATPAAARERLDAMLDFVTALSDWYDQIRRLPPTTLLKLMRMGAKIGRVVGRDAA